MRNFEMNKLLVLTLGVFVAACSERPTEPGAPSSPDFAKGKGAACPTPADVVVSDEASLRTALSAAGTGDVIAIDGVIHIVGGDIVIATPDVTLTCATRGSGLRFTSATLAVIGANGVTIERLVLDFASGIGVFAEEADDLRLSNNTVSCGVQLCAVLIRTPGAVIVDNSFEAESAFLVTGVHVNGADGVVIQRNTIVTTEPLLFRLFGGIRVNQGIGVIVSQNDVLGPWHSSARLSNIEESEVVGNRFEGAPSFGIRLDDASNNLLRANRVSAAGVAGVAVNPQPSGGSCGNVFVGNSLQGNADDIGAIFGAKSGANTLFGNKNVVVDNGDFDCDGDGTPDPNIINGGGTVLSGVNLGEIVSEAAVSFRGMVLQ